MQTIICEIWKKKKRWHFENIFGSIKEKNLILFVCMIYS